MKKLIALALVLIMCVTLVACSTATTSSSQDDDGYTPKVTVDPKQAAKDKLYDAYQTCCKGSKTGYASIGSDRLSLTVDTNPNDSSYNSYESDAIDAIIAINSYLSLPSSLIDKMESTRALDGMQTQNCGTYSVTWNYHPDNGLKVIYEVNP